MRINGSYELQYGTFYPKSVEKYVHQRVGALGRLLTRKLGDNYGIEVKHSKHSEASYIRIRNKQYSTSHIVTIRNHGNFANAKYDTCVQLHKFETWLECKRNFMSEVLPKILHDIDHEKAMPVIIRKEIEKELDTLERVELMRRDFQFAIHNEFDRIDDLQDAIKKEIAAALDEACGTI